ncbi:peroxiredoxin [Candidatus Cyanaurora vandensis]|uniref:peroxiredoxin n=1 Tax=Candidatus Cyanaurora vandensis TaxID=2714958 RepID=UPI00257C80D5|nr:peroxiredoxin [Candidatus Cyanaurora vandensis]
MALDVGAVAPEFTVKDTTGQTVSLAALAGQRVVLYFYPKDDTPGCTKEACGFRDNWDQYLSKGIQVYGVSADNESSHQAFTAKFNLPFPLLADTDGKVAQAYDAWGGGYAKRITYVIGPDGTIEQAFTSVNTSTHADDILASIK